MATEIWVNIGSGNGLLPDGTKPLPEQNVDLPSVRSIGIYLSTILQKILQPSMTKISWKIIFLQFILNLSGANELTEISTWVRIKSKAFNGMLLLTYAPNSKVMSNYIMMFYLELITYTGPNPDAGLANLY